MYGLLIAIQGWLFVGVFGLPSPLAAVIIWIIQSGLGALALLYLYRSFLGNAYMWLACAFAISVSTSAFVLTRVLQPNVAAFFLVPLVIAVIARFRFMGVPARLVILSFVTCASVMSSLWWVIVSVLMLPFFFLIETLRKRRPEALASLFLLVSLAAGLLVQVGLVLEFQIPGAVPSRSPWDSVQYGGHLLDFVVASPAVNNIVPQMSILAPGLSVGVSQVGLPLMLAGVLALALVFYGLPRHWRIGNNSDSGVLADAGIISLLFFLAGGLGVVQAAIAVILGSESPARVWSRLILIFSLVGSAYLLIMISRAINRHLTNLKARRMATISILCLLVASLYLDAREITPVYPRGGSQLAEGPALTFLGSKTTPCPVAQLPQEGQPVVRVPTPSVNAGRYYYRGFVPYLLMPGYSWSFGSWTQDSASGLNYVGDNLDSEDLRKLRQAGFCAILYDRKLAEVARASETAIEGRFIDTDMNPSFMDEEYAVWIL